ncbi:MAG TPA: DJ-1/PfpI family protein, partial [Oscillospiraceae bacterium]|nr:DJ-1/PfpI family protein [Oscillospiraceae bacterium]
FAEGFEEIEALTVVDILRRAKIDVITVGVGSKSVIGSHEIKIECDIELSEELLDNNLSAVVLPGGMPGTLNLEKSETVIKLVQKAYKEGTLLAAICAAPSVLGKLGLLRGLEATCYPGFEKHLEGAVLSEKGVCQSGKIITGRGMGCSIDFALKILENLKTAEDALRIRSSLQCV